MTFDREGDTFTRDLTALIPHMRAFARGLCGDMTAAEDLAQEALARAWSARASYQPGTNLARAFAACFTLPLRKCTASRYICRSTRSRLR